MSKNHSGPGISLSCWPAINNEGDFMLVTDILSVKHITSMEMINPHTLFMAAKVKILNQV